MTGFVAADPVVPGLEVAALDAAGTELSRPQNLQAIPTTGTMGRVARGVSASLRQGWKA